MISSLVMVLPSTPKFSLDEATFDILMEDATDLI